MYQDPSKLAKPHDASKMQFEDYWRSKREWVDPKRDQWEEWLKAYRAVIEVPDDSLMSSLVVPLIFTNIEDFGPRLSSNRPRIEVWGRHENDELRAEQNRFLLFYAWEHLGISLKMIDMVKAALIYGISWGKVGYRRTIEKRSIRRMREEAQLFMGIPLPGMNRLVPETSVEDVITEDDAYVDVCETDQVFPDPDGYDERSCSYLIHRLPITLAEIKAAKKDGKDLYDREAIGLLMKKFESGNPFTPDGASESLREMQRTEFDRAASASADPQKRQLHLLERWSDSHVTAVIEEFPEIPPIRHEWNDVGDKPFFRYTPIPVPNSLCGISLAEMLFSLQLEESTLHSLRMDNLSFSAHNMYKILRTSGINWRDIRFRPGGAVPVRSMGDIEPLQKNFTDFSLYREADEVRRWAQKVGSTDTFSGVRSDLTGGTATEATLLFEASASRATQMFQIFSEQSLKRMAKLLLRHYELYMEDEKWVRIAGDEFSPPQRQRISPEDLLSGSGEDLDVVFDVAATEPSNRQFRLARAKDMLQSFAAIGMPLFHPMMQFVLTELARAFGKENPEQLATSPEAQQASVLGSLAGGGEGGGLPPEIVSQGDQLAADAAGGGGIGAGLV